MLAFPPWRKKIDFHGNTELRKCSWWENKVCKNKCEGFFFILDSREFFLMTSATIQTPHHITVRVEGDGAAAGGDMGWARTFSTFNHLRVFMGNILTFTPSGIFPNSTIYFPVFFFKWDNYNFKFNFVIQAHWQVLPALKYLPLIRKKYFYIKIYVCNLLLPFESRFKVHVEFYFCYHCMRPSYASLTFSLDISMNVRFPVSECIN